MFNFHESMGPGQRSNSRLLDMQLDSLPIALRGLVIFEVTLSQYSYAFMPSDPKNVRYKSKLNVEHDMMTEHFE